MIAKYLRLSFLALSAGVLLAQAAFDASPAIAAISPVADCRKSALTDYRAAGAISAKILKQKLADPQSTWAQIKRNYHAKPLLITAKEYRAGYVSYRQAIKKVYAEYYQSNRVSLADYRKALKNCVNKSRNKPPTKPVGSVVSPAPITRAQTPRTPTVSGLKAGVITTQTADLTWIGGVSAVKYTIYNDSAGEQVDTVAPSYTFQNLHCNTTYALRVIATDIDGNGSAPSATTIKTAVCQPTITSFSANNVSSSSIITAWASDTGVNYAVTNVNTGVTVKTTQTTQTFTNLVCGATYAFSIIATDAFGNQGLPATTSDILPPCAPPAY